MQTQLSELLDFRLSPQQLRDRYFDCHSLYFSGICRRPSWAMVHWTDLTEQLGDMHHDVEHTTTRPTLLDFPGVK